MAIVCKWCGHRGQQNAMGSKINILIINKKKIAFLHSTNFKLRKIKGNSINNGDILKICNLCQQRPLLLLVPGIKNLAMPRLIDSAYHFYHPCNFMLLEF